MSETKKRIICSVGTRPEAIKMAPVIRALRQESWADVRILATAQHRRMLDQALADFELHPDIDLNVMQHDQSLPELTARLLISLDETLRRESPEIVLAQGDTTTVLATALACFYRNSPFCHVEAGLRTGDFSNPFPEEMNRVVASRLTHLHFAPTETARTNLIREGIDPARILVTGNTVIDALLWTVEQAGPADLGLDPAKRLILVTAHRRENFGRPLEDICGAIRKLAEDYEDIQILYPVHPNPNVTGPVHRLLGGRERIHLCEPLSYRVFVAAMKRSYLILTDSGGVQEEAPALSKPVLVLRTETERPEAVEAGVVCVVGTEPHRIVSAARDLLDDPLLYRAMAKGVSPYGDGKASDRIVQALRELG